MDDVSSEKRIAVELDRLGQEVQVLQHLLGLISRFGVVGARLGHGSWLPPVEMTDEPEEQSCRFGWPRLSAVRSRPRWTVWSTSNS
jgi:hypothetical protein